MQKLIKIGEAAKLLDISKNQLYTLVRNKKVPSVRIGGAIRFDRETLKEWIRGQNEVCPD